MSASLKPPLTSASNVHAALKRDGHAVLSANALATLCGVRALDFAAWCERWNDLPNDRYLLDGGHYRQRRHSCFIVRDGAQIEPVPRRPHWQSVEYNALHGGIERHFEPMASEWTQDSAWQALLTGLGQCASRLLGAQRGMWRRIRFASPLPVASAGRHQRVPTATALTSSPWSWSHASVSRAARRVCSMPMARPASASRSTSRSPRCCSMTHA